jgi:hypothetical protein
MTVSRLKQQTRNKFNNTLDFDSNEDGTIQLVNTTVGEL